MQLELQAGARRNLREADLAGETARQKQETS
jgi:hypothetical protein